MARVLLVALLGALAVASCASESVVRPAGLQSVRVVSDAASLSDSAHVVFVEHHSHSHSHLAAAAEAGADLSMDPAGHSPFRVRRVDIEDSADEPQSDGGLNSQHTHSLLEHATPQQAQHTIDVPLVRAMATPKDVEAVFMELRARQQMQQDSASSFIQLSEGESQDEMELDAQIEAESEDAHDLLDGSDVSAMELRSRDVPLYQEVLKEKHLATYYGTLRINDNVFRVLFDTGSCELWIPSDQCKTARCVRHKRFPLRTQTPEFFGKTRMSIEYISGKVAGPMIVSDVGVGGLTVPRQILGLAQTLDIELLDEVVWDGIVGMAYPSKSLVTRGVTPLFDNIIRQKLLSNPSKGLANQFAYYIDDTQGVMTFGGVNCAYVVRNSAALAPGADAQAEAAAIRECKNSFQFVPVTRKTYWTLTLDDVTLSYPRGVAVPQGQRLSGNCGRFGCRAIVDTGTYLLYTSKFFAAPEAWAKFAHCSHTATLPNITFHFRQGDARAGSKTVALTLEPREYVLKFDNSRSAEDCVVGISPDKDAVFTLGQVFLRAYYALFDRDENRIGFSKIHRHGHQAVNAKPSVQPPSHLL